MKLVIDVRPGYIETKESNSIIQWKRIERLICLNEKLGLGPNIPELNKLVNT